MTERSDSVLFPWETEPPKGADNAPAAGATEPESAPVDAAPMNAIDTAQSHEHGAASEGAPPDEPGATRRTERPLVRKEYYSISEVADLVGLPAHVLHLRSLS